MPPRWCGRPRRGRWAGSRARAPCMRSATRSRTRRLTCAARLSGPWDRSRTRMQSICCCHCCATVIPGSGSPQRTRALAAWALGEIEDADAVDPLVGALKDREPDVRIAASWALGQIESSRALEPLKAALHDESSDVQDAARWALN